MSILEIKNHFYEILFHHAHTEQIMVLCVLLASLIFLVSTAGKYEKLKVVLTLFSTLLMAFVGARLLHVFIEKPELLQTPQLIWTRFDGMTLNGSYLFGIFTFLVCLKFFDKKVRPLLWDKAALVVAFSYGLLKLGCFSAGCCWGKIYSYILSVKYYSSVAMPWLGIPVHPVQLYDSILGFTIFTVLLTLFLRKKHEGLLFPLFMMAYGVGRYFTEFYRGDAIRGENILFNMSTSQLSSLVFLAIGLTIFLKRNYSKKVIFIFSTLLLTSGCLPQEPADSDFKAVIRNSQFEVYSSPDQIFNKHLKKKNVLFLAADDNIQFGFSSTLKKIYKQEQPPRIEDLVFWQYAPDLKKIYGEIVRVPFDKVGYDNFMAAIQYLENKQEPYDLILLTHGLPNHLSSGQGYFLSYKDLGLLKGKLMNLDLVMLQACFGSTLSQDFLQAGARSVLSYSDFNNNYFFFGIFLRFYDSTTAPEKAYELAKANFHFFLVNSTPYNWVIDTLYKMQLKAGYRGSKEDMVLSLKFPALSKK